MKDNAMYGNINKIEECVLHKGRFLNQQETLIL